MVSTGAARAIREGARLSCGDIARHIAVPEATVRRWDARESRPSGHAAVRYLELLRELCNPTSPLRRDGADGRNW